MLCGGTGGGLMWEWGAGVWKGVEIILKAFGGRSGIWQKTWTDPFINSRAIVRKFLHVRWDSIINKLTNHCTYCTAASQQYTVYSACFYLLYASGVAQQAMLSQSISQQFLINSFAILHGYHHDQQTKNYNDFSDPPPPLTSSRTPPAGWHLFLSEISWKLFTDLPVPLAMKCSNIGHPLHFYLPTSGQNSTFLIIWLYDKICQTNDTQSASAD